MHRTYKIPVGKPEADRQLGRPSFRCILNVVNWIKPAQDRAKWRAFVNTVMSLRVHLNVGKSLDKLRNCQLLKKNSFCMELFGICDSLGREFLLTIAMLHSGNPGYLTSEYETTFNQIYMQLMTLG
jgi:hypothetical protein